MRAVWLGELMRSVSQVDIVAVQEVHQIRGGSVAADGGDVVELEVASLRDAPMVEEDFGGASLWVSPRVRGAWSTAFVVGPRLKDKVMACVSTLRASWMDVEEQGVDGPDGRVALAHSSA